MHLTAPVSFRWLGVGGIELKVDHHTLILDPFFTRPPFRRLWSGRVQPDRKTIAENINEGHFILVSHAHHDHLMDVPEVMRKTGALAWGSENTCQLLALLGIDRDRISQIAARDRFILGPFRVEVLPAEHIRIPGFGPGPLKAGVSPPLRLRDYRMDRCFCFLLQAAGLRFLAWTSERTEPSPPADVLFLGLTRKKTYLEALLSRVHPRLVIPVHWDDLFRPLTKPVRPYFEPPRLTFPPLRRMNLLQFRRTVEEIIPGTRVLIPQIFRTYEMEELLSS